MGRFNAIHSRLNTQKIMCADFSYPELLIHVCVGALFSVCVEGLYSCISSVSCLFFSGFLFRPFFFSRLCLRPSSSLLLSFLFIIVFSSHFSYLFRFLLFLFLVSSNILPLSSPSFLLSFSFSLLFIYLLSPPTPFSFVYLPLLTHYGPALPRPFSASGVFSCFKCVGSPRDASVASPQRAGPRGATASPADEGNHVGDVVIVVVCWGGPCFDLFFFWGWGWSCVILFLMRFYIVCWFKGFVYCLSFLFRSCVFVDIFGFSPSLFPLPFEYLTPSRQAKGRGRRF